MRSIPVLALAGLAAAGLAAAFVIWYLTANTDASAGPEEGVTLNAIVEQPTRYEGEQVTISGEWAENDFFPAGEADQVIVIGDDAGATLVAIPQLGVDVPEVDENTVLKITGEVRVPERGEAGYVDRGGALADGDGPTPIIAAERVGLIEAAGDPAPQEPTQVTVRQLLRDPEAFDRQPLLVTGIAGKVGGRGFTLAQDGATIFVSASSSALEQIEDGERVRVRAELSQLSDLGADALEKAIRSDPPGDQPRSALNLEEIPIEPGEPYLLLRSLASTATTAVSSR